MSSCLKIFLSFIVFVTLFACVPQYYQLSREQLELQESYKRALMERIGSTSKSEVEKQNEQYITEEELANKINGLPASSEQFFFTSKKDGFEINRKIYLDPEGQIVVYSGDSFTGDITYMVKIDTQNFVIKYMKASSNLKPIKLANAKKNGNSWQIKTVTGKTITGEMLSLVSKGFIVSRGSAAFLYSPGQDIKIISLPDGFHVAAFQNGEVMQTKYILIERDYTDEDKKNILNKVHSLGAALGVAKKEDYALFNFENNRIVFLNIDVSLKDVAYHKDCYKIGSGLINRCFSVQFQESLYRENGLPNGGHYYWRLGWFKSELGPLAIVKETTRVLIINLNENKMVKAFDRILGINWIVTRRNEKGKIEILAQLGFSKEIIDDVESFYFKNQHEAVRIES